MSDVGAPMALVLGAQEADALLGDLDLVRAGADAGIGGVHAAVRLDHDVVIGQQQRQVGVRRLQLDQHHPCAVGLDRLDAAEDAEGARLRLLVGMALDRRHHVGGGQLLAVVEGDALADLELPGQRVVAGAPGFGQHRYRRAVDRRGLDQHFAPGTAESVGHLARPQGRVEAVGGGATDHAELEGAALLGAFRQHRLAEQRRGGGGEHAQSGGPAEEFAPADAAAGGLAREKIHDVGHVVSLVFGGASLARGLSGFSGRQYRRSRPSLASSMARILSLAQCPAASRR